MNKIVFTKNIFSCIGIVSEEFNVNLWCFIPK